jgi:Protein of unknown function (DUF3574)
MFSRLCIAGLAAGLAACMGPMAPSCTPGMGQPVLVFSLFFGKSIPGRGDLTHAEWQQFLDDTVTVNLPNGYTVVDASGAWMNPTTRETIREASKLLIVALPVTPLSLAAVDRIRTAYQARFQQQLVGMTMEHACGSF